MSDGERMEPVRATAEMFKDMREHHQEGLVLAVLGAARRAEALVPELVGMSVGLVAEGVTFTLVASDESVAAVDAAQYAEHGPCVESAQSGETVEVAIDDLFDEKRWLLYAQASAARGIASSLSLPILDRKRVVGSVNLYGSTPQAFQGRDHALADALGASAEAVVRNADLSFSTRRLAAESAPWRESLYDVEVAVGILMARHGLDAESAQDRLREAAVRAGIAVIDAARAITGQGGI